MKSKITVQKIKKSYRTKWKYVLLIIPSLFFFVLFGIYPNLSVFPLSLYDWSPIREAKEYVGLHYYDMLFNIHWDNTIHDVVNTLLYIIGLLVIQTVVALLLSMALQRNTKKNTFFRAFFFLPMVFSSTMVSMIWNYMYDPNLGIINNILSVVGLKGYPGTNFFEIEWQAIILIVLVHIWANIGYPMMIFTSGLNTISGDIGEAAMMDGANRWQTFWNITFPLLLPTVFRLSLLTITTGAKTADYIVMMGGGKSGGYNTWASSIYQGTRSGTDYGSVCSMAVMMFFFLSVISLVQFLAMKKVEKSVFGEE